MVRHPADSADVRVGCLEGQVAKLQRAVAAVVADPAHDEPHDLHGIARRDELAGRRVRMQAEERSSLDRDLLAVDDDRSARRRTRTAVERAAVQLAVAVVVATVPADLDRLGDDRVVRDTESPAVGITGRDAVDSALALAAVALATLVETLVDLAVAVVVAVVAGLLAGGHALLDLTHESLAGVCDGVALFGPAEIAAGRGGIVHAAAYALAVRVRAVELLALGLGFRLGLAFAGNRHLHLLHADAVHAVGQTRAIRVFLAGAVLDRSRDASIAASGDRHHCHHTQHLNEPHRLVSSRDCCFFRCCHPITKPPFCQGWLCKTKTKYLQFTRT